MIDKQEVIAFSRELGLAPNVVEKDYILGWLLAGLGQHPTQNNAQDLQNDRVLDQPMSTSALLAGSGFIARGMTAD
ncbi:MAG TPA: hypothetical protein VJ733_01025 [Candidatus Binatia bacterium]|nr:hypothetical protein [Candidatus Binatia bacterium]